MPNKNITTMNVTITGTGRSVFGLWLLGVVAKIFNINLHVELDVYPPESPDSTPDS